MDQIFYQGKHKLIKEKLYTYIQKTSAPKRN